MTLGIGTAWLMFSNCILLADVIEAGALRAFLTGVLPQRCWKSQLA